MTLKLGDKVRKKEGYAFVGHVVFVGDLPDIGVRVIVKQDIGWNEGQQTSGGALHIFSPKQLEIV